MNKLRKQRKYLTPLKRTLKLINELSEMKIKDKDLREQIHAEVADKSSSQEKNNAIVFKYFTNRSKFFELLKNVRDSVDVRK